MQGINLSLSISDGNGSQFAQKVTTTRKYDLAKVIQKLRELTFNLH